MARHERDREDLMSEATALVERIELETNDHRSVIIGFRSSGCGSVFFGSDPVYQFNRRGELRRAYHDGQLFKAQLRQFVSLDRQRTPHGVHLVRHDLTADETAAFLDTMCGTLNALAKSIVRKQHRVLCQVPRDADLLRRVSAWLDEIATQPTIADSPHAR